MADILKSFYNACDPLKAATREYYVDADAVRGSHDLTIQFLRDLQNIEGDFLTFLFTGHIGCGKSSELQHLSDQLRRPDPAISKQRYFPIILDAKEFIDSYDVTPTDVLLSILARAAKEMETIGIVLQDKFLWRRLVKSKDFLKDLFFSDIQVPDEADIEASIPFAKVTAKVHLLKSDPANRQIVREALGRDISSLKEEIKHQFEIARGKLNELKRQGKADYKDFVLILDNLEKIDRIKGLTEGYQSHRQFFIDGASQLTGLGAHVVYTVPLTLVIHDGQELATLYGSRPFVLPMIKIEERSPAHKPYPEGAEILKSILSKRAGTIPLNELITDEALKYLIKSCGGHTRQLMIFIRSAITWTQTPPIDLPAAIKSIAQTVDLYSRMRESYWDKLAELELSPHQRIDSGDDDIKAMLQQLIILEYRNGDRSDDPIQSAIPWYGVHPLVRQMPMFLRAVEEIQGKTGKKAHAKKGKTVKKTHAKKQ